jgi:hypothetical protein
MILAVLGHGDRNHAFPEVRKGLIVAAPEAVPVIIAGGWGNRGIAEFVSSLGVWLTAVFKVAAGGFDAIVEALALDLAELLRGDIPAAAIMILAIPLLRAVLGLAVLGHE